MKTQTKWKEQLPKGTRWAFRVFGGLFCFVSYRDLVSDKSSGGLPEAVVVADEYKALRKQYGSDEGIKSHFSEEVALKEHEIVPGKIYGGFASTEDLMKFCLQDD